VVFPSTRLSVIERLRTGDEAGRREAFGDLVEGYWKAVYKYLRVQWRLDADAAEDLTQAFFSDAYQKEWLARYEPDRARFRTFVRLCADRFVMNARQSSARLKRGGAATLLSLDFPGAEAEMAGQVPAPGDPDEFFRQEFVRELFTRTIARVREEYAGRVPLALFERYDLDPAEGVSYGSLAAEFGLTTAQVTNALAQVRRAFRQHALAALELLCGTRDEFRREARELFGLDVE
jgi:DNA-directed RNA polymerase specialized sigma24 family protein